MKPASIEWPDTAAEVCAIIRELLNVTVKPFARGAIVQSQVPQLPTTGLKKPFIQVGKEATTNIVWPVYAEDTIRFTIWHTDFDQAFELAGWCLSALTVYTGPVVETVKPLTLPIRSQDPKSGTAQQTFTVAAHVAPILE